MNVQARSFIFNLPSEERGRSSMIRFVSSVFRIRRVVLTGVLVIAPSLCFSTSYYVSCTGSDSNNGTSSSTPWATLAKASAQPYAPGDQVLLLDGCVWVGTFQPTTSGISGNPITLSNYGSGALPRIMALPAI